MTFMAETTPANDETTAWGDDGAGGDETSIVAPPAQAAELAWSLDEPDTVPVQRESWRFAWSQATVLLLICAVVAVVIAVFGLVIVQGNDEQPWQPTQTPTAVLPSVASPAPPVTKTTVVTAPAPPPVTVTASGPMHTPGPPRGADPGPITVPMTGSSRDDVVYLDTLRRDGWTITNPSEAIESGHTICRYLANGHTKTDQLNLLMQNYNYEQAAAAMMAAIIAYCPQYTGT